MLSGCAPSSATSGSVTSATASNGPASLAGTGEATPASAPPRVQGQLTVFAAASLTDAFKQMAPAIEQSNPGTKITFNFAGSPTLRTQLAQGARADVFASADQPNMVGAQQDGSIASTAQVFARNRLVAIVPASGASAPTRLQDLARPGVKLVLAQRDVPAGNYARQALQRMAQDPAFGAGFDTRVLRNIVSEELDVKQLVNKVQLGEADAGICYVTDVTPSARSQVKTLAIPDQFNVIAQYPIAVAKGAPNAAGAQQFIDYVLSPAGQQVLKDNGFIVTGG
ncbi:MAG TPA: molybdate ABC transporter substrate-binding protein [Dehalococcoidia bacterium]|nr:molybdate ABC transporter substrate-binding protein [Dehalococcoidia bacterium]